MRSQEVKKTATQIIQDGRKPSAQLLAQELDYALPDVHRCLNSLEKKGEIESYTKEILGNKTRMVAVKR